MSEQDARASRPTGIARMMELGSSASSIWEAGDLSGVLRHQLDAPLRADLVEVDSASANAIDEAERSGIKTFADLLFHPAPALELLLAVKRYAKLSRHDYSSPLPQEVAMLLYLLSISAALLKCGQRISDLNTESLRSSLRWYTEQKWVDLRARELLSSALSRLEGQ